MFCFKKVKILTGIDRYLYQGKSIDDTVQSECGQFNFSFRQGVEINQDNTAKDSRKKIIIYSFDPNNKET